MFLISGLVEAIFTFYILYFYSQKYKEKIERFTSIFIYGRISFSIEGDICIKKTETLLDIDKLCDYITKYRYYNNLYIALIKTSKILTITNVLKDEKN